MEEANADLTWEDRESSLASPVPQTQVTEETRLAVAVHHIDEEVSVVPRGAFVKDPLGIVKVNRSFGGVYGCLKNKEREVSCLGDGGTFHFSL